MRSALLDQRLELRILKEEDLLEILALDAGEKRDRPPVTGEHDAFGL
jgi:hypothetical protein